jgi:hypothetical protein
LLVNEKRGVPIVPVQKGPPIIAPLISLKQAGLTGPWFVEVLPFLEAELTRPLNKLIVWAK